MLSPLDIVLRKRISTLETLSFHLHQEFQFRSASGMMPQERLSYNAQGFWAARETKSPCARNFADRVEKIQRECRMFLSRPDWEALDDYVCRQKQAACEVELGRIEESLRDLEDGEVPDSNNEDISARKTRFFKIEPSGAPLTFSVALLSVNTSARMLVAKDPDMPFVLKFSPHTQRYQLADSCCGHPECDIDENLSHYYLDPAEIALVFWAPGMLFVHTETRVYKKEEKAEYCNLGVKDVEELEELMEHMKMKGIPVQQVTREVLSHSLLHG